MGPSWVAVFDFDGTCISQSLISLFNVLDRYLSADVNSKLQKLRGKYVEIAKQGKLTSKNAQDWYFETIKIYIEAKLTLSQIKNVFSDVVLKKGVVDCFRFLKGKNVPVAIISYGVVQFIGAALKANNAWDLVSRIYSGRLIFDSKSGKVVGCEKKTVIFPSNKDIASRDFADFYGVPYENILAVGDSGSDFLLGYLKENRLGIVEGERERIRLGECGCMQKVIVTDDFEPVTEWLTGKINFK